MIEIEWIKGTSHRILTHSYGTSCIDQQYFVHALLVIVIIYQPFSDDDQKPDGPQNLSPKIRYTGGLHFTSTLRTGMAIP